MVTIYRYGTVILTVWSCWISYYFRNVWMSKLSGKNMY